MILFLSARVYTDEVRHDLDLLRNTWLIDEFEQSLKSMADYRKAENHLMEVLPSLVRYSCTWKQTYSFSLVIGRPGTITRR